MEHRVQRVAERLECKHQESLELVNVRGDWWLKAVCEICGEKTYTYRGMPRLSKVKISKKLRKMLEGRAS